VFRDVRIYTLMTSKSMYHFMTNWKIESESCPANGPALLTRDKDAIRDL
jgi:hypothetical protein